jgi:FHA domain
MVHQPITGDILTIDHLIDRLGHLPTYSVGRLPANTLRLSNSKVSGHHATLIGCSEHVYVLEDLDSKNGTFVNDVRITRKVVGPEDRLRFADDEFTTSTLLALLPVTKEPEPVVKQKDTLDFSAEFVDLQAIFEQYPKLRKNCRDREKMIRSFSVVLSSMVGVGAALGSGGTALAILPLLSSAGLSVLIPTLCSTLLSTDEKLEVIDKEYRERYRCPNPACRDPFGSREWDMLALQKTCRQCKAIWVA